MSFVFSVTREFPASLLVMLVDLARAYFECSKQMMGETGDLISCLAKDDKSYMTTPTKR